MRTVVLINTHSRQASQHVTLVKNYFKRPDTPFEVVDFIVIDKLTPFEDSLKKLKDTRNIACVIVGSGDGTIVAVLNALKKRKNLVYGFIPLGTSNTFVRSLGIPVDLKKSLKNLSVQHIRKASLGQINGTLFPNIADIGVPARVAENLTDKLKKYLGSFAYAVSGFRELVRHDAIKCEIEVDGQKRSFYSHQVFIANGKYRGPLKVSKDTSAYSNELTLGYSDTKSRFEYLRDAFGFVIGTTDKRPTLHFLSVQKATIKTNPVQNIQADGEVIGKTPARIEVVKDAIRVFAPEPKQTKRKKRISRQPRS